MMEMSTLWIQVMAISVMHVTLEPAELVFVSMAATFPCATVGSAQRMPKTTVGLIMNPMPVSNAMCSLRGNSHGCIVNEPLLPTLKASLTNG